MNRIAALAELRKRLQGRLGRLGDGPSPGDAEKTAPEFLLDVATKIVHTRDRELSSDECAETLDQFVELSLAGGDVEQLLPLLQHHLMMCGECREEYESLLRIVRSAQRAARKTRTDSWSALAF